MNNFIVVKTRRPTLKNILIIFFKVISTHFMPIIKEANNVPDNRIADFLGTLIDVS